MFTIVSWNPRWLFILYVIEHNKCPLSSKQKQAWDIEQLNITLHFLQVDNDNIGTMLWIDNF